MYAIGKDAAAMKAVVGEEALSTEEKVSSMAKSRDPADIPIVVKLNSVYTSTDRSRISYEI